MKDSLVSICIPTYNGQQYIREALDSAISQTYSNIEIVIVDDGSSDSTIAIINEYQQKDKRIKFFRNTKNLGLVGNWNKCIEHAGGEWIKFLFQDDYLSLNMIEHMMQFASPENKFLVCNRNFVFEEDVSDEIRKIYASGNIGLSGIMGIDKPQLISAEQMSHKIAEWGYKNYIGEPTSVLFHKSIVNEIGYFNNLFAQICDLEYWFRASSNYGLFFIPDTLATFRIHNESTSNVNRKNKKDSLDFISMLHELSFGKQFQHFREYLSYFQILRLKQLLKYQVHIFKRDMKNNPDESTERYYLKISDQIPYLKTIGDSDLPYYFMKYFIVFRHYSMKAVMAIAGLAGRKKVLQLYI